MVSETLPTRRERRKTYPIVTYIDNNTRIKIIKIQNSGPKDINIFCISMSSYIEYLLYMEFLVPSPG